MEGSSAYTTPRLLVAIMPLSLLATPTRLVFSSLQTATQPCSSWGSFGQGRHLRLLLLLPPTLIWGACLPLRDCLATATLVESYHESRIFETLLLLIFGSKIRLRPCPAAQLSCPTFLEFRLMPTPSHFPPYFLQTPTKASQAFECMTYH